MGVDERRHRGAGLRGPGWWRVCACVVLLAGAADGQVKPRVVGGSEAPRGKYPWMVSLARRNVSDNYQAHYCGAVLIHPHWVLTAAHCVDTRRPDSLEVVVGAHNLQTDEAPAARRVAVREILLHPDYDDDTSDSDLALLVLAEPVTDVPPLEIIDDEALCAPGTPAFVLGWGATSGNGTTFPPALQEVGVPIVSLATANALPVFDGTLTENMLPAGPEEGGRDSCQGDSGGPLIVASPVTGVPVVAGVVSFGPDTLDCGEAGGLGIYTRLIGYRPWIYACMRPVYGAWERKTGAAGERRDPDGNGLTHWEEFALGEPPGRLTRGIAESVRVSASGLDEWHSEFTFPRRAAPEVRARAFFSAGGPGEWIALDLDALQVGLPVAMPTRPGLESVTLAQPLDIARHGFYRVEHDIAPAYVAGPRPVLPGQLLRHRLHILDPLGETTRFKEYEVSGASAGSQLTAVSTSVEIQPLVSVVDAATGAVIWPGPSEPGQSRVSFPVLPDAAYRLRMTAATLPGLGDYSLSIMESQVESIARPQSLDDRRLDAEDLWDPVHSASWAPCFKDDYIFIAPEDGPVVAGMQAALADPFDTRLIVLDARTGAIVAQKDAGADEGFTSEVSFEAQAGRTYVIRCTSALPATIGIYSVSLR